jgi:hypothetical protein
VGVALHERDGTRSLNERPRPRPPIAVGHLPTDSKYEETCSGADRSEPWCSREVALALRQSRPNISPARALL